MIALLQRVNHATVAVDSELIAKIDTGLLVFLCAQPKDQRANTDRLVERILNYRIFPDENGKMNRSVTDISGGVLLVPQFTLSADTSKGNRPGFSHAAAPDFGNTMFTHAWLTLSARHANCACGVFGADMKVSLENDGPATFWLEQ